MPVRRPVEIDEFIAIATGVIVTVLLALRGDYAAFLTGGLLAIAIAVRFR